MKKLFFLLITVSFISTSCSKKGEEERISTFKLLTKIVWYNNNQLQATDVFSYDENDKITGYNISFPNNASISSDNIYEGDKLVKTNEYVNGSNSVSKYFTYQYTGSNIVKTSVYENNSLTSEETFTYTNNSLSGSEKTVYSNGNPSSTAFDYIVNTATNTVKKTERNTATNYTVTTYDTKNHPFSDTSYILAVIRSEGNKNYNNPIEIKHYTNNTLTKTLTITNEYDTDGFLTTSTRIDSSNSDIFEVHYTYNK